MVFSNYGIKHNLKMMGLKKISTEDIRNILVKLLKSFPVFTNYALIKENIQELNSPTKITNYDFEFVSEKNNRWLFIRIQDFFGHQRIIMWLNELTNKKSVNIDIVNYFISELNDGAIKQRMIFNATTKENLELKMKKFFDYIDDRKDEKLEKVLLGELWIEMPFDWGDYK